MQVERMPRAWVVHVWTNRLGGDRRALVTYVSAFGDRDQAVDVVKRLKDILEEDDVQPPIRMPDTMAEAIGILPSEVWVL